MILLHDNSSGLNADDKVHSTKSGIENEKKSFFDQRKVGRRKRIKEITQAI